MTRLKQILLTGTMVPALALTPIAGAFAQIPATVQRQVQERQQQEQQRQGGGQRAPGGEARPPAGGMQRGQEAPRQAAPRAAAPVERAAPAERAAPNRAERMAPPAERAAPPRAEHVAPAERAAPPRAEHVAPAERAAPQRIEKATPPTERATPNRAERAAPAERATPPAAARATPPATRAEKPATRAERPADAATPPTRAERRDGEGRPGERANNPAASPAATPAPAAQGQPNGNPAMRNGQNGGFQNGQRGPQGNGPNGNQQGNQQGFQNDQRGGDRNDRRGGISPGGAAAIGAAAGFAGGFLAATGARDLAGIRNDRRQSVEDGRTYIREPGRTIVEDGDRSYIVHDENDRFRELGYDVHRARDGRDFVDTIDRPDGTQILTYTTPDGRMLRRVRRTRDGREFVLIDNSYDGGVRSYQDDVVDLPPPRIGIPRERYDVDYADVDEGVIYDTFAAPPLQAPPRRYTLDQIRFSPDVRRYVRSVDINTINFDSGSWIVPGAATGKLQALAAGMKRTIAKDPNTVFLVEGFTDATGNPTDNLSLSDRRAQSVAAILTKDFNVPPENLTTQGYGQQNLKVNTQGPSAANRRVVVQNITPLLAAGGQPPR